MPIELSILSSKISMHLNTICQLQNIQSLIGKQLYQMVYAEDFSSVVRQHIELLDNMPSVGFITAVTLMVEIGDFSLLTRLKLWLHFWD